jgi:outer membrane protein TolC
LVTRRLPPVFVTILCFMNPVRVMIRRRAAWLVVAALGLAAPAAAQTPLTLTEAITRARAQNPDAGSAAASEREAAQRVTQARAGYLPKVDVAESWQRGNQPVFVFSSLLAAGEDYVGYLGIGAIVTAVALALAAWLFDRRLLRRG